jgi:hypothetical protein
MQPEVSIAADDIMMVVLVVIKVIEPFEPGGGREQSCSDGILLLQREVLGPYILGGWHVQSKSESNRRI